MKIASNGPNQGLLIKTAIIWLCIFLLVGFLAAARSTNDAVTLSVIPEVPKTGEPVVATFNLNNADDKPVTTSYELYVNGRLLQSGSTTLAPQSSSRYQYAYDNPLERGEQANFVLKTSSANGVIDKIVSLPAYPPQLMSSFVSFAAFSTSVMSSMISMEYFNDTFGTASGLNTGIIIAIILIALLLFLELTQVVTAGNRTTTLARYRASFSNVAAILFIIFVGMVFTQVIMIIGWF
jgi:hypothetical protein